jgi:hypothetical protein
MRKFDTKVLVLFGCFVFVILSLFFFTYTQVDLNLTLTKADFFQTVQKSFQYVGFYQRPCATIWFTLTIFSAYILYGLIIHYVSRHAVSIKHIWIFIGCITIIGVFAYPAFSYDIFNYLFTAKTVLVYGKDPYIVKPIFFTGIDPWLNFMRWTHLVSAYTPLWILLSTIPYLLGFGYFLLILLNTKILLAVFFLLTAWGILKIVEIQNPKQKALALVVFACNPLVIIEAIVSPHNDIVMMACAMFAWYFYLSGRRYLSYLLLATSVAAKLMTIVLYPVAYKGWKKIPALCCMVLAMCIGFWKKELLPWYFLWVIPYVAVMSDVRELVVFAGGMSLALVLRYAPFIYFGEYNAQMQEWRTIVTVIPLVGAFLWVIYLRVTGKKLLK